jgi:hypothetical protein
LESAIAHHKAKEEIPIVILVVEGGPNTLGTGIFLIENEIS